jgi:DNA-binding protein H-NS
MLLPAIQGVQLKFPPANKGILERALEQFNNDLVETRHHLQAVLSSESIMAEKQQAQQVAQQEYEQVEDEFEYRKQNPYDELAADDLAYDSDDISPLPDPPPEKTSAMRRAYMNFKQASEVIKKKDLNDSQDGRIIEIAQIIRKIWKIDDRIVFILKDNIDFDMEPDEGELGDLKSERLVLFQMLATLPEQYRATAWKNVYRHKNTVIVSDLLHSK